MTAKSLLCQMESLPAGRIHSIGKGCFIAEIQQTSDLTYRIYDFGRLGLDGKPRELHTELAKDAIDYSVSEDYRTAYIATQNEETPLVECEYFKTHLLDLTEPMSVEVSSKDSFMIVICLEGNGELTNSEGNVVSLRNSLKLSNKFVKHDFTESKLNHSLGSISMKLVVYSPSSEVFQPCERSFNDPSFWDDLEFGRTFIRSEHDFKFPSELVKNPVRKISSMTPSFFHLLK